MKVLLDARPVRDPVSGVARYCIGLGSALANAPGIELVSLVGGGLATNKHLAEIHGAIMYPAFRDSKSAKFFRNVAHEYIPNLMGTMLPGSFDIAHETYFGNIAKPGRALVATVHDLFPIEYPTNYDARNVKYSLRNYARQVRCADQIIAVSEYTKKRMLSLSPSLTEEAITVIGNAVDFPTSQADPLVRSQIASLVSSHRPYLLTVGNIEPRKNLKRLVLAWSDLRHQYSDAVLVFAGKSIRDSEAVIDFAKSELGQQFLYLGSITEAEKWALLRAMSGMVFPSLLEGYGIPVIEAYLSHRPCVFSGSSALRELAVSDHQIFDPESVESIKDAIARLLSAPEFWNSTLTRSFEFAVQQNWKEIARRTTLVYARALSK